MSPLTPLELIEIMEGGVIHPARGLRKLVDFFILFAFHYSFCVSSVWHRAASSSHSVVSCPFPRLVSPLSESFVT